MLNIQTEKGQYEIQWYPNQFFAKVYKSINGRPGNYNWEYFATLAVDDETTEAEIEDRILLRETEKDTN